MYCHETVKYKSNFIIKTIQIKQLQKITFLKKILNNK